MHNQAVGENSNSSDKLISKKWRNRIQLVTLILISLIIIVSIVFSLIFILYKFNSEVQMMKEKFDDNLIKFKKDLLSAAKENSVNRQIDQIRSSLKKIKENVESSIEQHFIAIESEMYDLIPEGFVYTQLPGQKDPKELWPQFDWLNISHMYLINFNDTTSLGRHKGNDQDSQSDNLQKKRLWVLEDQVRYQKDLPQPDNLQSNYLNYIKSTNVINLWQRV